MKNLKDYQIIILIAAFFISALTLAATLTGKPTPEKENKNFVGVDAAGFKHYPNGDMKRITLTENN